MYRTAQCSCGSVTLVTMAEPDFVVACHCRDCQRRTGSAFGVGAYFPAASVTTTGPTREYVRPAEAWNHFHFCPVCATTTHWHSDKDSGLIGIAAGAFDAPGFLVPARSVWEQSKHDWVAVSAARHFPRGRED